MLDLTKYGDSEQGPLLSGGSILGSIGTGGLIDDGGLVAIPRRQVLLNNALGAASVLRPQILDISS